MTQAQKEVLKLVPETSYHYDKVIFLENSNGFSYEGAADTLREFLVENKVRHNVLYNLGKLSDLELKEVAESCLDTLVVFETTGTSESFRKLINHFIELTNSGYRFRFIECSVNDFQMYVLPKEVGGGCISYHNLECSSFTKDDDWTLSEVTKRID